MKETIEELRARVKEAESPGDLYDLALEILKKHEVLEAHAEGLEEVLRSLASYVAAGGYNADTVDPKVFEEKIRWGIDHLVGIGSPSLDRIVALEAKNRELEMRLLASRSARKQAEEDRDRFRDHVKTGYSVACDLSRALLDLQEKVAASGVSEQHD